MAIDIKKIESRLWGKVQKYGGGKVIVKRVIKKDGRKTIKLYHRNLFS